MPPEAPASRLMHGPASFDGPLGQRIIDLHIWAVEEGLRGANAHTLFDGYCQRLVIYGAPLWRANTATETLHPQWSGYGYTWRRDLNAIQPQQFERANRDGEEWVRSPFFDLIARARAGEVNPWMRRRLDAGPDQRDFPILDELYAGGAADYLAWLFIFGENGDRSHGSGVVYSFASDKPQGFSDDDVTLMHATLPGLSLAMKADAGHTIASGLLSTYLGEEPGRRIHAGAVERGSVESLRAVLWYADIRGFTPTSDSAPGSVIIEMLDAVFEALTAALRPRGGQVLKFLGDGMLATFSFEEPDRAATCARALDAACEAMRDIDILNSARAVAGLPIARVDLALHIGEVLYGNVGAADRLDFTVIGPAVNEVARIETLCEPLDRAVLVSSEFASAVTTEGRLEPLGRYALRGVREPKEIFALSLTAA